jgi:hypothetical protein
MKVTLLGNATVLVETDSMNRPSDFYVVAEEPGAEHPALPTWANENANPIELDEDLRADHRAKVDRVEAPHRADLRP